MAAPMPSHDCNSRTGRCARIILCMISSVFGCVRLYKCSKRGAIPSPPVKETCIGNCATGPTTEDSNGRSDSLLVAQIDFFCWVDFSGTNGSLGSIVRGIHSLFCYTTTVNANAGVAGRL